VDRGLHWERLSFEPAQAIGFAIETIDELREVNRALKQQRKKGS
jgi:hypothetical protein